MRDSTGMGLNTIDDNPLFVKNLGTEFKMEIIAPTSVETDKYIRGVKFPFNEEQATSNPNANWLCTVLKIYNDKCCILLTSDADKSVFSSLGMKKGGRIKDKVILAQIPHHGSKGNLNKPFWTLRKRIEETPVVISVGKNGYNHPSKNVVNFFDKNPNYKIYSTNKLGGLKSYTPTSNINQIENVLDIYSTVIYKTNSSSTYQGDKSFLITGDTITLL